MQRWPQRSFTRCRCSPLILTRRRRISHGGTANVTKKAYSRCRSRYISAEPVQFAGQGPRQTRELSLPKGTHSIIKRGRLQLEREHRRSDHRRSTGRVFPLAARELDHLKGSSRDDEGSARLMAPPRAARQQNKAADCAASAITLASAEPVSGPSTAIVACLCVTKHCRDLSPGAFSCARRLRVLRLRHRSGSSFQSEQPGNATSPPNGKGVRPRSESRHVAPRWEPGKGSIDRRGGSNRTVKEKARVVVGLIQARRGLVADRRSYRRCWHAGPCHVFVFRICAATGRCRPVFRLCRRLQDRPTVTT